MSCSVSHTMTTPMEIVDEADLCPSQDGVGRCDQFLSVTLLRLDTDNTMNTIHLYSHGIAGQWRQEDSACSTMSSAASRAGV